MNCISNFQGAHAGRMAGQEGLKDAWFGGYASTRALSISESLDAGVSIMTTEGDIVTLSSSSFTRLDSFMYDSKGVVRSDSGKAVAHQQYREVTLASGKSFSFSVQGELNEQELQDIAAIVKGVDAIISGVMGHDVDGVMDSALSGSVYGSVSSYVVSVKYNRSVALASGIGVSAGAFAGPEQDLSPDAFESKPVSQENTHHKIRNAKVDDPFFRKVEKFLNRLLPRIEKQGEKQLKSVAKIVDKLFKHHLDEIGKHGGKKSLQRTLGDARDRVRNMFEPRLNEFAAKDPEGELS